MRLDHRQRIAVAAVVAVIAGPVVARTLIPGAIVARTLVSRALVSGALVPGTVIAAGLVLAGPVVALLLLLAVAGTVVAVPAVAVSVALAVLAFEAVAARAVVAGTIITRTVVALAVVAGALVALRPVIPGPFVLPAGLLLAVAVLAFLRGAAAFSSGLVGGLGLGLGAFILEIDVEAGGEVVAPENLGGGPRRLHGAQQAEIVLGVLEVVLPQDPVAGGVRVAGELLVLLEDVLRVAADLHALGAVRIERAVGVLLLGLAAATTTAATAAVPPALTLHTLEISHYSLTVLLFLERTSVKVA